MIDILNRGMSGKPQTIPYRSDGTLQQVALGNAQGSPGTTLDNDALCELIVSLQENIQQFGSQAAELAEASPPLPPTDTSQISPMEMAAMRQIFAAIDASGDKQATEMLAPAASTGPARTSSSDESSMNELIALLQAHYTPGNNLAPGVAHASSESFLGDLNRAGSTASSSSGKGKSRRGPRRKQESLIDLAAKQQGKEPRQPLAPQKQENLAQQQKSKKLQRAPTTQSADSNVQGQTQGTGPARVPKFCPYCGATFRPYYRFCEFCGADVVPPSG
jgi:hypothetical protein